MKPWKMTVVRSIVDAAVGNLNEIVITIPVRHSESRGNTPYSGRLAYKFTGTTGNFSLPTNKSCQTSNRTLALLNSLWRSTLVRPIAVSHTVFLNEDRFLRFLGLRGKFFPSLS